MPKSNKNVPQDFAISAYVKLIRTGEALHAEVSRGLALEGLTASQFSTLKVLKLRGAIPQKDIATYLLKTGGNVTVVVDNLEREGLVTRTRGVDDRRLVLVALSPTGEQLFDRIYPAHLQRIRRAMAPLDQPGLDSLLSVLEELHPTIAEPLCSTVAADEVEPTQQTG